MSSLATNNPYAKFLQPQPQPGPDSDPPPPYKDSHVEAREASLAPVDSNQDVPSPSPAKHVSFLPRTRVSPADAGANLSRREKLRTMFDAPTMTTQLRADEIVAVPVRLQTTWQRALRRGSSGDDGGEFDLDLEPLPDRPVPRGFRARMGTRTKGLSMPSNGLVDADGEPYTFATFKMPRIEYVRHFRRDRNGKYLGTEPEEEWTREQLRERYGRYQKMKLFSSANDAPLEGSAALAGDATPQRDAAGADGIEASSFIRQQIERDT